MFNLENEIRKSIPNLIAYFELMKGIPSFTQQEDAQEKFNDVEKHIFDTYRFVRSNANATLSMKRAKNFMSAAEEILNQHMGETNDVKWSVMLLLNLYMGK